MICTILCNKEDLSNGVISFCGYEIPDAYPSIRYIDNHLISEGFTRIFLNEENLFYQHENYPPNNISGLVVHLTKGTDSDTRVNDESIFWTENFS